MLRLLRPQLRLRPRIWGGLVTNPYWGSCDVVAIAARPQLRPKILAADRGTVQSGQKIGKISEKMYFGGTFELHMSIEGEK